jgi:hypothetical protein
MILDMYIGQRREGILLRAWITKECDSRRSQIGGEGLPSMI